MRLHGDVLAVGVEGTDAYSSELARFLHASGVSVVDVDRPDRKARRINGKSDPVDAYAAATAALSRPRPWPAQDPRRHRGSHPPEFYARINLVCRVVRVVAGQPELENTLPGR
ncbi:hypothetical protein [Streptomyces sp. NPDC093970]|uniref:hypothetical protein n=1 Tax=Streptomyces sp. NPDC093970 TaxID=3155076 RepID=UPI00343FD0B5